MVRAHDEVSALRTLLNDSLGGHYKINFITPTPVTGGGTTGYIEAFLTDMTDTAVEEVVAFELGVYSDEHCTTPSTNATLTTETKGLITDGDGLAVVSLKTGSDGYFKCEVHNEVDEPVYFGCGPAVLSPILDYTATTSLTFSA